MIDRERLRELAREIGVELDERALALFERYACLLSDANQSMNLTAVTDPAGIVLRHFADSLTLVPLLPEGVSLIDVGCGAGFPGVPAAIARGDIRLTLLDSLLKRLRFLETACAELAPGARAVHARAEDAGRERGLRENYDVAAARAVAPLPVLCEYCLPFVRVGGRFVALKGPQAEGEIPGGREAAAALGASLVEERTLRFPAHPQKGEETLCRKLLLFEKTAHTPALYPRSPAQIRRHPLGSG